MNGQQLQHPGELALYMRDHTARIEYALGGNYPWHTATSADHAAFEEYMGRLEPGRFWGAVQVAVASYDQHPTEARAMLEKMLRPVLYDRPAGKAIPLTSENRPLAQYVRLDELEPGEGQRVRDLLRGLPRVEGVDGGYYAPRGLDLAKLLGVADSAVRYTRDAQGNEHDPKSGEFTSKGGGGGKGYSDQRKSELEQERIYSEVSEDPAKASIRDLVIARGYLGHLIYHEHRRYKRGETTKENLDSTVDALERDAAYLDSIIKDRINDRSSGPEDQSRAEKIAEKAISENRSSFTIAKEMGLTLDEFRDIRSEVEKHIEAFRQIEKKSSGHKKKPAASEPSPEEKRDVDEFFSPDYQPPPPPGQLFAGESKREQTDKGKLHIPARQPNPARPMTEEETREFFKPRSDEPEEEQGRLFERGSMAFQYTKDAAGHEHKGPGEGGGQFTGGGGSDTSHLNLPKLKRMGKKKFPAPATQHKDVADALGKPIEHSGKVLAAMRHGAPNTTAETQRIAAETGLPHEQVHGIIDRLDNSGHIRVDYDPVTKEHTFNLQPPKKT